ncbi:MAG: ARMT1-like domain-containing protein [Ignavibacteriaceae bacterium]
MTNFGQNSGIQPGCIPCIVKQAYTSSRLAGITDPVILKNILYDTLTELLVHRDIKTSPHFSIVLQSIIGKYIDIKKAYKKIKHKNLEQALKYVNYLNTMIEASDDKLEMAVRTSIAGNTIDIAANPNFDIDKEVNVITSDNINLDSLPSFKNDFKKAKTILFIGDNYEEAVFDKFLLKQLLPKEVVFAVRSNEILNDITMEDALNLKINELCRVIESGSVIAGVDLEYCTHEFVELYNTTDIVIAKGQGNFETLYNANRPIYFMFKVKCEVIAGITGYPVGTSMLYYHNGNSNH